MKELISERKHLDNLYYIRELIKLDIDNWVEENSEGQLKDSDDVIDMVLNLSTVEECMCSLYTKLKYCDKENEKH